MIGKVKRVILIMLAISMALFAVPVFAGGDKPTEEEIKTVKGSSGDKDSISGVVIVVQTYGDFLNFNPHLHVIATDGCFKGDGDFIKSVLPQGKDVEKAFQSEVLKMLKKEGKINQFIIDNMLSWGEYWI